MNIDFATVSDIKVLDQKIDKILEALGNKESSSSEGWNKAVEICRILKCSPSTLSNYREKNLINWKKMGGTYYYKIKNFDYEN